MAELDNLLKMKRNRVELSQTEKKIIDYLRDLKGKRPSKDEMAKEIGIARKTFRTNLERLEKNKIISSSWILNPFSKALRSIIVQTEVRINKSKEKDLIKMLKKYGGVDNIRRTLQDSLLIDFIVRDIEDYKTIKMYLEKKGMQFLNYQKIITENLSEQ